MNIFSTVWEPYQESFVLIKFIFSKQKMHWNSTREIMLMFCSRNSKNWKKLYRTEIPTKNFKLKTYVSDKIVNLFIFFLRNIITRVLASNTNFTCNFHFIFMTGNRKALTGLGIGMTLAFCSQFTGSNFLFN